MEPWHGGDLQILDDGGLVWSCGGVRGRGVDMIVVIVVVMAGRQRWRRWWLRITPAQEEVLDGSGRHFTSSISVD